QRRYPAPGFRMSKGPEWSVRMTRNGFSSHFPLGTMERRSAAIRALEIQQQLDVEGWDAVCRVHSRELTLGFHWSLNPVLWTYTTVHTCTARELALSNRKSSKGGVPVMIVESDENLRCAMEHWCGSTTVFGTTEAVRSAEEAMRHIDRGWQGICLVNHSLRDMSGHQFLERLERHAPGVRGFIHSTYEDSEQLFVATPGGAAAYLYRRVAPDEMLQPLAARPMRWPMTDDELRLRLRRYLEESLKIGESTGPTRALELLTGRERQILELLSGGHVEKEIAARLGISVWTVHGHVKRIFEKLGVRTRTEAVVKYLQK
ncbi:MAG TPA: response regulator transcription factor, partial [Roseimicrobium sp.]|nr:response regulator transcription factor [Roseimicrobium sp.]